MKTSYFAKSNIKVAVETMFLIGILFNLSAFAQTNNRTFSGTVVTHEIPLDKVEIGRLDRFGVIDPFNGGRNKQGIKGIIGAYYRKEFKSAQTFKVDGFLRRSLFDLTSDFTFFLLDPVYGDQILQHDSRLEEGVNSQYLLPYKLFGRQSLLTFGGNFTPAKSTSV